MGIVDAHVHVWDVDAFPIPWFREDLGLPRTSSPEAFRAEALPRGVSAGMAVQVADSVEEARWLTAVTSADEVLTRAVLQYEPAPGRALGATAVEGAAFYGIRAAVPQFAADLSDVPGLDDLADALGTAGRVLELLIRPEQLEGAAALARRHPVTPIVLCHLGLGHGAATETWRSGLAAFAAAGNAHAKFSGLLSPTRTDAELSALARTARGLFGADRLMFGSDWPMSARTHTYAEVIDAVSRAMPDTPAFWSGTAERLYPLP
ncbi:MULTISPECIES: amidohydrolase [unclassified Microbacterium]|uniref:amidohydrolase family protein n=1 Tax=unclassified Microbacterium TaxID=2609290 RepID=UPI0012FA7031|nr:amidohydrolase family protein [Microbacterium sp. MAH-37]MVQ43578.1 amidohydrolase family protein [Microbacterium sp. MAH-37]